MRRAAFTLIELLVSIAIIAVLMGIGVMSLQRDQRGGEVRRAAEELSATLAKTRKLAMAKQQSYAVVFNIENAPGSSGRVLNNRSGGHWYRILGPSHFRQRSRDVVNAIPWASSETGTHKGTPNFPDFTEEVRTSWIEEAVPLKAGKVRFLAIGDTDEGPRTRGATPSAGGSQPYAVGGDRSYPRPWFGYFDTTQNRLFPWGGYDRAIPGSGFHYEGTDGAISGCVNPTDRRYDNDFTFDRTFSQANELNFPLWIKDEARPLVNAAWLDACIIFLPNGNVLFGEWNRARRYYENIQAINADEINGVKVFKDRNGVRDRSKPGPNPPWKAYRCFTDYVHNSWTCPYDIPEVAHFDRHTGGWFITLAPDSRDDRDSFPDAKSALASMTPMWRVYVGSTGSIRAMPVANPIGWLDGRPAWPPTPSVWEGAASNASDPLWQDCRLGWLHQPDTGSNGTLLIPRGKPITDVVTTEMLSNRVWWLDTP